MSTIRVLHTCYNLEADLISNEGQLISYDVDPNFDNSVKINTVLARADQNGDISSLGTKGTIILPGKGYTIKNSIVMPTRTAIRFVGTGGGTQGQAEDQHGSNNIAGPESRLIWRGDDQDTDPLGAMLRGGRKTTSRIA